MSIFYKGRSIKFKQLFENKSFHLLHTFGFESKISSTRSLDRKSASCRNRRFYKEKTIEYIQSPENKFSQSLKTINFHKKILPETSENYQKSPLVNSVHSLNILNEKN